MPVQLLTSEEPLSASLFIASFGSSKGYNAQAFKVRITQDPAAPLPSLATPPRYGKLPEIHHIFKSDPRSPPVIISLVFSATVVLAFPALLLAVSVHLSCRYMSLKALSVALARRKCQSPFPSSPRRANPTCSVLWLFDSDGRSLLYVLYILEPIRNSTGCFGHWAGHFP